MSSLSEVGPQDARVSRRVRGPVAARIVVSVLLALVIVSPSSAAWAHGGVDKAGFSNYETNILSVAPDTPGIEVSTFGVDGGITLVNRSLLEVVVLGYNNEPYLRLDPTGTYANLNSPATYVNGRRDANVPVPDEVTSSTTPNWYQLSDGNSVSWHDHRAHWMGTEPPDAVLVAPNQRQVVYPAWEVPLLVGGRSVTVTGELVWLAPPDRTSWLLISLGLFLGAVLVLWFFRSVNSFAALGVLACLVANTTAAASRASVERADVAQRVACFIAGGITLIAFGIGLALKKRSGTPWWWGVAGAVAMSYAVSYRQAFSFAAMDGTTDPARIRWVIAVQLGIGAALAITAFVSTVERRMLRRANVLAQNEFPGLDPEAMPTEPDPEVE
ncbi:MAG: hypothetical protein F2934_02030 [Actinobacteria bacterium]|nr:hypothetical protein [Actinomycetota bacterium]MSZ04051.1 hypothetical protein [Actinomycetota bacterium]MTB05891.1 hypothetical protein [Actinomycetota bacterium]